MRLIEWETTRWGNRRCQLTLFVNKYDDPHYLFRNWDWQPWYCAERHWTSSVLTFWSEYQNTADLLRMKPHQVQNYDLYNRKGLSHTSDKPLEAGWRKLIIKQATHPLKGEWSLVLSPIRLNTWTTIQTGQLGCQERTTERGAGRWACIVALLKIPKGAFKSHQFPRQWNQFCELYY